jgi:hypothetical protein
MELCTQAKVHCLDGLCGDLIYVVLKPNRDEVAYIVVQEPDPPQLERMIPIELITKATSNDIYLDFSKEYLHYLSPFRQAMFVAEEMPVGFSIGWPGNGRFAPPESRFVPENSTCALAEGTAIHKRARVATRDGEDVDLAKFIVDRPSARLTHLGLRHVKGLKERQYLIPFSEVAYCSETEIGLKLTRHQLELLPQAVLSAAN